ncbi:hypothetical protein BU17DRAFT_70771 [Hysterangium stoloniferum]|nr:hypothetical protein BU17DRAFT_70771 [Hysterangium stoloniferum]
MPYNSAKIASFVQAENDLKYGIFGQENCAASPFYMWRLDYLCFCFKPSSPYLPSQNYGPGTGSLFTAVRQGIDLAGFFSDCSPFVRFIGFDLLVTEISVGGILLARVYAIMPSRRYLFSCLALIFLSHMLGLMSLRSTQTSKCVTQRTQHKFQTFVVSYRLANSGHYCQWIGIIVRCSDIRSNCVSYMDSRKIEKITPWDDQRKIACVSNPQARMIIAWGLQIIITETVEISLLIRPPNQSWFEFTFVVSVSALVVLRFFLDLRDRNAHQNGISRTKDMAPCSLFKAAARKMSNAIIGDIGDPEDEVLFTSQTSYGNVSGQLLGPSAGEAGTNNSSSTVSLQEFPWAAGRLDDMEAILRS